MSNDEGKYDKSSDQSEEFNEDISIHKKYMAQV